MEQITFQLCKRTASFFYVHNELPVSTYIHVHFKQGLRQLRNWSWEGKETPWTDVVFALGKYFYWTSYLFLVFDPPRLLAMVTWMVNSLPGLVNAAANNEHSRPHQCQYHINVALFWNKHLFPCHLEGYSLNVLNWVIEGLTKGLE